TLYPSFTPLDASSLISGISSRHGSHQLAKKFITSGLPRKAVSPKDLPSSDFKSNGIAGFPAIGAGLCPPCCWCCAQPMLGVTIKTVKQYMDPSANQIIGRQKRVFCESVTFIGSPWRFSSRRANPRHPFPSKRHPVGHAGSR